MLATLLIAAAIGQCQPGQPCYRPVDGTPYIFRAPVMTPSGPVVEWRFRNAPGQVFSASRPAMVAAPRVVYSVPRPFVGPTYTLPAAPACVGGQCYRPR